jgi:pyruvate dehydrogenase kinase 2/3/4
MSWKKSARLMDTIQHYASFPATGVSLRQMVQFGEKPSTGPSQLVLLSLKNGAFR